VAKPDSLQSSFDKGVKRDFPRNQMPKGSLWGANDCIPNLGAPLRERGGWANASLDISAAVATSSYVIGGIYAPYEAGVKNILIDEDGRAISFTSAATTDVAACVTVSQNPVIHRDIVVVPASGGATSPKKITNSAGTLSVGSLGGSPPQAVYATVFKDRTCLGYTSAEPQRLYFSDPGDPEGWDTTNVFWDFSNPITGLASVRNSILVFHDGAFSRLYGSTPPPGGDFTANDPLFAVGCTDARSIAVSGDRVVFANPDGIFLTDGSAEPADITALCGMRTYWQSSMSGYTKSSWTIVAGFLRGDYIICVMDGSTFKFAARVDIANRAWWPLTNVDARCMWEAQAISDELYFGRRGAARVGSLSSIYMPSSTVKNDGDGDAVAAVVETPFYENKQPSALRFKKVYLRHELTDYASDDPTVSLSYIKTPEETAYTSVTGAIGESTTRTTTKKSIDTKGDGIALKLTRANAGDFLLYGIEAELHDMEGSRRAS
jgi:hypothetical protein